MTGGVFKREPFGKPGKASSASSVRGERSDFCDEDTAHRVRRARISLVDRESFAIWSTRMNNGISAFQPLARAGARRSHAEMESSGRCSPGRVAPLRPARPAAAAACPPDPNCHAQHRAPRAEVEDGPADGAREARAAAHDQQARSRDVLRVLARDLRGRTGPRVLRLLAPRQLVDRDLLRRQHALLCVFVQVPVQPVRTAPVSDLSLQLGGDDPPQGHGRASRCARRAVSKAPGRKTKEILSRTSL